MPKSCKVGHVPKLKHFSSVFFSHVLLYHRLKQAKEPKPSKGGKLALPLDRKSCKVTLQRGRDTGGEGLYGHVWPVTIEKAAVSFTQEALGRFPKGGDIGNGQT